MKRHRAIRLINGTNDDTDTNTYIECNNTTNGPTFFKQVFIKWAVVIFNNDTVFLPVSTNGIQLWRISNNGPTQHYELETERRNGYILIII